MEKNYNICPSCKSILNTHTHVGSVDKDSAPTPKYGDLTICFNCYEILIFEKDLSLRKINSKDIIDHDTLSELINAQKMIKKIKNKENKTEE